MSDLRNARVKAVPWWWPFDPFLLVRPGFFNGSFRKRWHPDLEPYFRHVLTRNSLWIMADGTGQALGTEFFASFFCLQNAVVEPQGRPHAVAFRPKQLPVKVAAEVES